MQAVFMRYPDGKPKAVTFSYDDGVLQDERLCALFDKYGVKGTFNFNIAPDRPLRFTKEQVHSIFLSKGHEIAVHGAHHRASGHLRSIEGIRDILDCRLGLEEICGRIIRGMAYPDTGITRISNAESYEKIRRYLSELDIAYARTLGGDNDSFLLPEDFLAWMPTAHHNNPEIMDYIDRFLKLNLSVNTYYAVRMPRLFYIWGHSYEFDRNDNWAHMEEIVCALANKEDIWYATNIEICEYVEAYKRLRYSADGHTVQNPTSCTVWLDVDGKIYSVPAGETVHLIS